LHSCACQIKDFEEDISVNRRVYKYAIAPNMQAGPLITPKVKG